MKTFAEFQIIGRVGRIREIGSTLRISIASEYGRKDEGSAFRANPHWNEVTIFNDRVIAWVRDNVAPGDLVHTRGTLRQTDYEKDGQTIYGVTLAAGDFDLLARKKTADYEVV